MLFSEFERLIKFINNQPAPSDQTKKLVYHLPSIDYILFGIELFIRGRITIKALESFFSIILQKEADYRKKIESVCIDNNIEVTLASPFSNLFDKSAFNQQSLVASIFKALEQSTNEVDPANIDETHQKLNEQRLVHLILQKLQTNHNNEEHRNVWADFLSVHKIEEITTLDKLFKLANAVMLAIAAKGKNKNETCALLPLTEYRIFDAYNKFQNNFGKLAQYNEILNIMFLDPLYSLGKNNDHTAFSTPPKMIPVVDTLIKKDKQLALALNNAALFSRKNKPNQSEENHNHLLPGPR